MSCSVAVAGASPVFSPRVPPACKVAPETLTLTQVLHAADASPSAASSSSSSGGGPSSPFRLRLQRGLSAPRASFPRDDALDSPGPRAPAADSFALPRPLQTASTILKRKRPARIDIPVTQSSPDFAARPSVRGEAVEADTERFSVFCKRGKTRKEMEDRYKAEMDVDGDPRSAFFGVFDGHGGTSAAVFAAENIGKRILSEISKGREGCGDGYEEAVRSAYLKTDMEFLEKGDVGGACCVTAVIIDADLIVSNAGDCRAVLSSNGTAEALTSDHRPCRDDERERIERLGGYLNYCHGVLRVLGSLAVSRGIGDGHLKQWVIAEPETRIVRIKPEHEFLILASDGLWDKVNNQEAVDIARPLCVDSEKPLLLAACKKLVDLSVSRGSVDDASVMIIRLRDFM